MKCIMCKNKLKNHQKCAKQYILFYDGFIIGNCRDMPTKQNFIDVVSLMVRYIDARDHSEGIKDIFVMLKMLYIIIENITKDYMDKTLKNFYDVVYKKCNHIFGVTTALFIDQQITRYIFDEVTMVTEKLKSEIIIWKKLII